MKKAWPFFLLLCSPAFAQTSEPGIATDSDREIRQRVKNHVNFYFGFDHETRDIFTDHGLFHAHQSQWPSYTLAFGWTGDFTKHLCASATVEYCAKFVETDTMSVSDQVDRTVFYKSRISLLNIPVTAQFMFGNKFRFGLMSGAALKYKILESGSSHRCRVDGTITSAPPPGKKDLPLQNTLRYNMDLRLGVVAEYNFSSFRIRLIPVYRIDLFNTYHNMAEGKASNYGIMAECDF